jgi:chemotaxis signal transduction protein
MLRTAKRHGQTPEVARPWSLVMFSVGGKRLAVRAEEIGGVSPWTEAMPVPSLTPYVNAVIRQGEEILPVFDLARLLMVQVSKAGPLCLRAKRQDGPMAVCIDPDVPTLHQIEAQAVRPPSSGMPGVIGVCSIESEDVPIYSWALLGPTPAQQVA